MIVTIEKNNQMILGFVYFICFFPETKKHNLQVYTNITNINRIQMEFMIFSIFYC